MVVQMLSEKPPLRFILFFSILFFIQLFIHQLFFSVNYSVHSLFTLLHNFRMSEATCPFALKFHSAFKTQDGSTFYLKISTQVFNWVGLLLTVEHFTDEIQVNRSSLLPDFHSTFYSANFIFRGRFNLQFK